MGREIPEIVRAAAGLAATVLDEARRLPETLPSLPIRLLGFAMQQAMRVQQQYAGLVARGDEIFTGLRGDAEPGLATFDDDDDDEPAPATATGFRDSAFDQVGTPDQSIEEMTDGVPAIAEVLDEIAIDEMVDQAPTLEETAPAAADARDAEPTADGAATVDVLGPDGDIATVEATVTDEGIAAPEGPAATSGGDEPGAEDATGADEATATDESGTPVAAATRDGGGPTAAPGDVAGSAEASAPPVSRTSPIDGYDSFTIAQLRGRLRGYALSTVQDLVAYEEATRARAPYLKMLRNRLEKLEEQAVESSPLAPRGA